MENYNIANKDNVLYIIDPNVSWNEAKLTQLMIEHKKLDHKIKSLISKTTANQIEIQQLKKKKLLLKDRITYLRSLNHPDIIA